MVTGAYYAPKAMDRCQAATGIRMQRSSEPADIDHRGSLFAPGAGLRERGSQRGHVCEWSVYTRAVTRPLSTLAAALLAALAVAAAWWVVRERDVWRRLDERMARLRPRPTSPAGRSR